MLSIAVNPVGMTVGHYYGNVVVGNAVSALRYDVDLTVSPPFSASPSSLTFNAVQGSPVPPSQTLIVGSSLASGAMITSSSIPPSWVNVGWIAVGTAPMSITVSITSSFNNLSPGTYTTSLVFEAPFTSQKVTVPITLNVAAPPPVLKTNVNQLQFSYAPGTSTPAAQSIQVTSSGSSLTANVSLSVPWLAASALTGTTPFTTNIGVNPNDLAVGTYSGRVTVATSLGSVNSSSQNIDVTLTIAADTRPVITSVVNAASFKPIIGPGAWISIMGSNLAKTPALQSTMPLPISLNGVSAELRGVGGVYNLLLQFVSPTQINAFVPHELPVSFFDTSCSVAVTVPTGATSITSNCQGLAPALFSYGAQQYASATHLDGAIIGLIAGTRPAQTGEIITLWGTGFGQTAPPVTNVNGVFAPQALANPVAVYVGGQSVQVLWAGMVGTGLYQFNIQLPDNLTSGDVPISIKISGTETERVMLPIR